MTKRQSTSKSGVSSNRKRFLTSPTGQRERRAGRPGTGSRSAARGRASVPAAGVATLDAVLAQGRERLASAESVLACLHVALLYADDRSVLDRPDHASAAALAIGMLREVRDLLDAASLRPLLAARSGSPVPRRTKRR